MTPEAVRSLRKRLGLTQAQLAAELGTTEREVRRWERGEHRPWPLAQAALRRIRPPK